MTQDIVASLAVTKVVKTVSEEQTVAVTLKGQKTIVHCDNGFDLEDIVEITTTLKFSMQQTAKALGVSAPGSSKVCTLRDRDESLSGYDIELHPAMQQTIA